MIIELTKDHKKPNGRKIKKGTKISVVSGHPYKDFKVVQPEGVQDEAEKVTLIDNTQKKDK